MKNITIEFDPEKREESIMAISAAVQQAIVEVAAHDWKNYARPAFVKQNEAKEKYSAVKFSYVDLKKEVVKQIQKDKLKVVANKK